MIMKWRNSLTFNELIEINWGFLSKLRRNFFFWDSSVFFWILQNCVTLRFLRIFVRFFRTFLWILWDSWHFHSVSSSELQDSFRILPFRRLFRRLDNFKLEIDLFVVFYPTNFDIFFSPPFESPGRRLKGR